MKKSWKIIESDEELLKKVSSENDISLLLANLLINRNIVNSEDITKYLNPTRRDFYDPFLMPDMDKAIQRIEQAIDNNEKAIIFGDYDVDGITATSLLLKFFKDCNYLVDYYIPNRLDEGYGLNEEAVRKIAKDGYTLIITVDCGITCNAEVELANSLGIDVVVTDHHEPGDELPKAIAVVDCKRKDNTYPFRGLAGCRSCI